MFALQRAGVEVWPVLTVNFSNHTGYGSFRGPLIAPADVAEVVAGIDDRGVLNQVDALLTGFQGSLEVGDVVVNTARLVKERNPNAIYCADPVMGDVGRGFYARPGIPEFMRDQIVPIADIMTPNLFELEFLTGRQTSSTPEVLEAAQQLRSMGPEIVVVTSVTGTDVAPDLLRMIATDGSQAWSVETPLLDRAFTGSGDLTSAMFLAHWLNTSDLAGSLSAAASIVYSVLQQTASEDSQELRLVSAQENIVRPKFTFEATRIA